MMVVSIAVTGPYGAGVRSFISTMSDTTTTPQTTEHHASVTLDFGRVTVDDELTILLFGIPGQARFHNLLQILLRGKLGVMLIVDAARPETFREARLMLRAFLAEQPVSHIIALTNTTAPHAVPIDAYRQMARLSDKTLIVPLEASDKESCKSSLLEMLYAILDDMD